MRTQARPRRDVSATTLAVLRPVLRYSTSRDAYVLRGVGNRMGPVLRARLPAASQAPGGEVRRAERWTHDR